MLSKTKLALRIKTNDFDDQITDLIEAGIADIKKTTGADFDVRRDTTGIHIADALARQAVIGYVACHFGDPDNYERLKNSYDEQKAQLRCNSSYGMKGGC